MTGMGRDMTGWGGYDGMGGREWGTQRRKDAMKSRRGIPAYAGMTGWTRDMTWVCCGNDGGGCGNDGGIGGMT